MNDTDQNRKPLHRKSHNFLMVPIRRALTNLILAGLLVQPASALAQGIPVFDASTFAQTVQSVSQGAQQVTSLAQQVIHGIQNLIQMPQGLLSQANRVLGPGQSLDSLKQLHGSVSSLMQSAQSVQQLYSRAQYEMSALQMTHAQWMNAYLNLAQTRGGIYQQQLNQDVATLQSFQQRAQALQKLSNEIPSISGNVQGLQLLNQQANVQAAELMQINAVLTRQATLDMQEKTNKADLDAASVKIANARMTKANNDAKQNKKEIGNMPDLKMY